MLGPLPKQLGGGGAGPLFLRLCSQYDDDVLTFFQRCVSTWRRQ